MIEVPEGWEIKPFSSLASINMGQSPESEFVNENQEGIAFLQGNADFGDINPKELYWVKVPKKLAKKDDILISVRAPVGDMNMADKEYCIGRGLSALTIKKINQKFGFYALFQERIQLDRLAQGSTFLAIGKNDFDKLLIKYPKEKKEQEKIAKILSTLDNAIESTNRIIEKEKNIKTALMQELLTNGIDKNGQIRTPQTHTYKQSELGLIPDEWEVDKINEVTKLMTDFVANGSFESLANNVTVFESPDFAYYVRLVDIRKGLGHEKQTYVNEQSFNFLKKSSLTGREILIANIGANVGETFLMPILKKPATIAPNMIVIKVNSKIIPEFLFYFLTFHKGISELQNVTEGSGQPKINKTKLKTINIIIPLIKEQEKIIKILNIQDKRIEMENKTLAKLKELKKGLMNDLLSGVVRVNV